MFAKADSLRITFVYVLFVLAWMTLVAVLLPHQAPPRVWLMRDALFLAPTAVVVYILVRRASRILRMGEARYREMFEDHPDAMCVFDDQGRIVQVNRSMVARYGYTRDELIDMPVVELTPEGLRAEVPARIKRALGMATGIEWRHRRKDGSEVPVEISSRPIMLEGQHFIISSIRDISQRKAAEADAERSIQRSNLARRIAGIGIWEWDVVHDQAHWTPEVFEAFGLEPSDNVDLADIAGCIHPDDLESWHDSVRRCVENGVEHQIEFRVVSPDGQERWIQALGDARRDDDGRALSLLGVVLDVTDRKLAEAQVAASAQRFKALFDAMIEGAAVHELVYDAEGRAVDYRVLELNPAFERQTGMDRSRLVGALATEAYQSTPPPYLDRYERVVRTGTPEVFDADFAPWGKIFRVSAFTPGPDQFVTVFEDVTERRHAADALRESERVLATLMSNLPGMAYRCLNNPNWDMEFISDGCAALTGHTPGELTGQGSLRYADLIHPDDRDRIWQEVQAALARGVPFEVTYRIHTASGEERWVWEKGRGVNGVPETIEGFIADITAHKRAEAELLLKSDALEHSINAFDIVDSSGRFVYANRAYLKMWGYDHLEEIVATSPESHCADPETVTRIIEALREHGRCTLEFVARRKDGSTFDVLMAAQIHRGPQGQELYMGTSLDISDRKRAEEERRNLEAQLRQAQKMEAIGQLAGGVAHDFNNILTAILGNVELARAQLPADQESGLQEDLDQIERSANRAASLTRQLLAFSRRQIAQPRHINLNDTLTDMEQMLRRLLTEHIALHFKPGADLHTVHVDPGHIEQVLMNLVVNARDAMPDGGDLTIETANAILDADYAAARAEVRPGEYVVLSVSDTGTGMDAQTAERVFEPFFTTKAMGQGTGLGLSTVYGIIKQAGGHVAVYTEPARGATFRVYLPAAASGAEPAGRTAPVPKAAGGHETILLCEDDNSVRTLAQTILEQAGYVVLSAANGREARAIAAEHAGAIDILVTDVIMPDMNGRELATALKAQHRRLRTLYISGYTANVIAHHGVLDDGVEFLEKPFTRAMLLARVRGLLDGDPAS